MSLFRNAVNQTAFLKAGLLGFQGSGKTYTAVQLALGLYEHCKESKKPIMYLDTETGSDWAIPEFARRKVPLQVAKTRAFCDLLEGVKEAERSGFLIIIDSVTHYWVEMVRAYKRANKLPTRMGLYHWGPIKDSWSQFSDLYVNSEVHAIICGRAGWEYAHEEDEEGKLELVKAGTKMKAEGEFGYEPSLLLEMQRIKGQEVGAAVEHRCTVLKDRRMDANTLDGKVFINPKFEDFLPHIECLALGSEHVGAITDRRSDALFEGVTYTDERKSAEIAYEELIGLLEHALPGQTQAHKVARAAIKKHVLGTYSDTAIAGLKPEALWTAIDEMGDILEGGEDAIKAIVESEIKRGKTK